MYFEMLNPNMRFVFFHHVRILSYLHFLSQKITKNQKNVINQSCFEQTQKHIQLKMKMPLGQEVGLSKYLHTTNLNYSAKVLFSRKI